MESGTQPVDPKSKVSRWLMFGGGSVYLYRLCCLTVSLVVFYADNSPADLSVDSGYEDAFLVQVSQRLVHLKRLLKGLGVNSQRNRKEQQVNVDWGGGKAEAGERVAPCALPRIISIAAGQCKPRG